MLGIFRFDEIAQPGEIAPQFMRLLGEIEAAIFDITFANANVYYELGVRQANAAPQRTLLVAQKGTRPAFNISHHQVWFYDFANPQSWPEFSGALRSVLEAVASELSTKEPLAPPPLAAPSPDEMRSQVELASNRSQLVALWSDWKRRSLHSIAPLLSLAAKLLNVGHITAAVDVAKHAYELEPTRHDVVRTYGWYLRKSGDLERAETQLRMAIQLNPGDTEALGMLGGVYKRRGRWQDALDAYARGATIDSEDVYILVNLGAIEAILNPAEPLAGRAIYRKVLQLVGSRAAEDRSVWDLLSLGEARLMVDGTSENAEPYYRAAVKLAPRPALQSAAEQLELFQRFAVVSSGVTRILDEVLRPALADAPIAAVAPPSAPRASHASPGAVILHLSDLHFGSRKDADGKERSMHRFGDGIHNRPLYVDIVGEVKRLLNEGRKPEDVFLVASGDVGYLAREEEYALARTMFDEVRTLTGLRQSNIVVVPGNHDVSWLEAKGNRGDRRFNEYIFFLRRALGKTRFVETHPHVQFDPDEQLWPEPSTLLGFYEYSAANLFFAGLNSCILETDAKHFGLVGGEQLELLRQRLEKVAPECIRVAVMHHHVIPIDLQFEEASGEVKFDLSITRDFGIVETLLQRLGFDLVLHGHKHMPALRESALRTGRDPKQGVKRLIVCGAGSVSVAAEELPPGLGNHFSVLRMLSPTRVKDKPFVDVEWRGLAYDATATWQTLERWALLG